MTVLDDSQMGKTYGFDPKVPCGLQIRVYVSPADELLRIRQGDHEIVLSQWAVVTLLRAFWLSMHAHKRGIRGSQPGYGEAGYVGHPDDEEVKGHI